MKARWINEISKTVLIRDDKLMETIQRNPSSDKAVTASELSKTRLSQESVYEKKRKQRNDECGTT
ncbi:13630_t:CDS:2 [Rhizophagus irregularis]|nr:13630_t:CDS:2 [Rhizophagus irregularis]